MSKNTMNNETEFMFDETLTTGFTTVYNEILMDTRLSDSAIGLYCRIIRFRNIPDWKINQSTLEHENNKRTKVEGAMKELVKADYIEKIQLRNEKGQMNGVKYIVYSKSKSFGTVENTNSKPNAEKPKSGKPKSDLPKSVNLQLKIKNNTNKDNTNKYTSSSSKGKTPNSIHPLVELFNESICELKKTTTVKFMRYVEKYDEEFIKAVITYCEEHNANAYSYFEKTIKSYIEQGITTVDDMNKSIENFKGEKKSKKNNALKAKDEIKKEERFDDYIEDRIMDDLAGGSEPEEKVNLTGDDIGEEIKALVKPMISEVSFNTWIKNLEIRLDNNIVIAGCSSGFIRDIVEKRYSDLIKKSLELKGLSNNLRVVVVAE